MVDGRTDTAFDTAVHQTVGLSLPLIIDYLDLLSARDFDFR